MKSFELFSYHEVIRMINKIAEKGNLWFNEHRVWDACEKNPDGNEYLMGNAGFIVWLFAELSEVIMPNKSKKIKEYISIKTEVNLLT